MDFSWTELTGGGGGGDRGIQEEAKKWSLKEHCHEKSGYDSRGNHRTYLV
jgi:hypothetical protein